MIMMMIDFVSDAGLILLGGIIAMIPVYLLSLVLTPND